MGRNLGAMILKILSGSNNSFLNHAKRFIDVQWDRKLLYYVDKFPVFASLKINSQTMNAILFSINCGKKNRLLFCRDGRARASKSPNTERARAPLF